MPANESSAPRAVRAGPTLPFPNRLLFPDASLLRARRQTVIRVRGRENLMPGAKLDAMTEGWQIMCPVPLPPVARLEVVSVRQEPLRALLDDPDYAESELSREAVASGISPKAYVARFMAQFSDLGLDTDLTRIEFRYL